MYCLCLSLSLSLFKETHRHILTKLVEVVWLSIDDNLLVVIRPHRVGNRFQLAPFIQDVYGGRRLSVTPLVGTTSGGGGGGGGGDVHGSRCVCVYVHVHARCHV